MTFKAGDRVRNITTGRLATVVEPEKKPPVSVVDLQIAYDGDSSFLWGDSSFFEHADEQGTLFRAPAETRTMHLIVTPEENALVQHHRGNRHNPVLCPLCEG